jgi:hypothetical protein
MSAIAYRPGRWPASHLAARSAPWANVSRFVATWVSSSRSPRAGEVGRVPADLVADPQGVQADLAALPHALVAVAVVHERVPRLAGGPQDRLGQPHRGAARGVLLEPVVPLDDLRVVVVAEAPSRPRRRS